MPHLDVPGASLYYETNGPIGAPPVLLIHAGVATLRMWDPLVPHLDSDHYVIRFDTRGFGQTVAENVEFSDRGDALDLLDHLGVKRPLVVGCSRGGGIALDFALEYPDRAAGVVTIGSGPSGFPDTELTEHEEQLFVDLGQLIESRRWHEVARAEAEIWTIGPNRRAADLDPAFVELAYDANRPNASHIADDLVDRPLEPPAFERLGELRVPVLATVGDEDISECIAQQRYLVENIADAEGYVFENAAHLPSLEHPDEFADVIADWMLRHDL